MMSRTFCTTSARDEQGSRVCCVKHVLSKAELIIEVALWIGSCHTALAAVTTQIPLGRLSTIVDFSCTAMGLDYFDSSVYACQSCPVNQEPDPFSLDGAGNSDRCRCMQGFQTISGDCLTNPSGSCSGFNCTSCTSIGLASFSDRLGCAGCDVGGTLGLGADGDCRCPSGEVLLEKNIVGEKLSNKTCGTCPAGSAVVYTNLRIAGKQYLGSVYECQICPDALMTMVVTTSGSTPSYSCRCPDGYTLVGIVDIGEQSCLRATLANTFLILEPEAILVDFTGTPVGVVESLTFQHYFVQAASRCTFFGGPQDVSFCQLLANLCVLQLFAEDSVSCTVHRSIIEESRGFGNTVLDVDQWAAGGMPWLYISNGDDACTTKDYTSSVSLNSQHLEYVVAVYAMNGTFLGFDSLETLFSYCRRSAPYSRKGAGDSSSTSWQQFGSSETLKTECELSSLFSATTGSDRLQEQRFYELFLHDPASREAESYSPIPVRVVNIPNDKNPNFLCDSSDILVRRFYLVDVSSGIASSEGTATASASTSLLAIRYASYIALTTSLQTGESSVIYSTVLTIEYTSIATADAVITSAAEGTTAGAGAGAGTTVETSAVSTITIEVAYTMNMHEFFVTLEAFFIAGCIITGLLFFWRYYTWTVKNARVITESHLTTNIGGVNLHNLVEITILATNTWVVVFFPIMTLIAWYFFVFFKIQSTASVMLPPQGESVFSAESPYYPFAVNLQVIAIFQLAYVCLMVYRQCISDIFFIDWEPAKARPAASTAASKAGQVSVWRSIMVANEWAEMQTMRKTDIRFTLFFIGFFLLGLNLEYNATQQPNLDDKTPGEINVLLRFANTTFFWAIISLAQYLWKFLIYERYFSEPPEILFIDFCTIAKISVLVMDEKYHGYYLHCRSPHQYADGTMPELVEMLHKEEAGLTVDRSLEGAPPDVQSFSLFVSGEWRTAFDRVFGPLVQQANYVNPAVDRAGIDGGVASGSNPQRALQQQQHHQQQLGRGAAGVGRGGFRGGAMNLPPPPRLLRAWSEVTYFLQEFVENNFGEAGLRRVVREPTYFERISGSAPDLSIANQPSVFFTDRAYQYTGVLFLGREVELLLMNVLAYSLFDLWFNSTLTSILLCYLLDCGISAVRHSWGKSVLSSRTLIDGRFLI